MNQTLSKGILEMEMKNITTPEMNKLRDYFVQLAELQIHRFKNGKIIMHFDNEGELMKIDVERVAWKRVKKMV